MLCNCSGCIAKPRLLIGTGRVGPVRLSGGTNFEVSPQPRFRSAEVSAYWSASDRVDWEGALAFDAGQKRARARIAHVRRLSTMTKSKVALDYLMELLNK